MKKTVTALLLGLVAANSAIAGTAKVDGNILNLEGNVDSLMKNQFNRNFSDDIDLIKISSPGGFVKHGLEIAKVIADHPDIAIEATGDCKSMCAVIWLSGNKHVFNKDGNIGFHLAYVPDANFWEKKMFTDGINGVQHVIKQTVMENVQSYIEFANHPEHIDTLIAGIYKEGLDPQAMYYPSLEELMEFEGNFVDSPEVINIAPDKKEEVIPQKDGIKPDDIGWHLAPNNKDIYKDRYKPNEADARAWLHRPTRHKVP